MEKYLPPTRTGNVIPFKRKVDPIAARVRQLENIYLDRSQPFGARVRAAVQLAVLENRRRA